MSVTESGPAQSVPLLRGAERRVQNGTRGARPRVREAGRAPGTPTTRRTDGSAPLRAAAAHTITPFPPHVLERSGPRPDRGRGTAPDPMDPASGS